MADIHPTAIVAKGAEFDEGVVIGPYCIVGAAVKLGRNVRLTSHVVVEGVTEIGDDCEIHAFANIGGPPQHLAHKGEPTRLVVGARNIIREHATIHTGTVSGRGVTTIGSDGLFMASSAGPTSCCARRAARRFVSPAPSPGPTSPPGSPTCAAWRRCRP